jgi:aspartate/methionine/tyrosine aminotransferase
MLKEARKHSLVKTIFVNNPGDPTGKVMTYEEIAEFIKFCEEHRIAIIVNETLENTIFDEKFHSFRHVVQKLESKVELFSINSISKGPFYNAAFQGGLLDILNIDNDVAKELYKFKSIDLCSALPGQIMIDLVVNPPVEFGADFMDKYNASIKAINNDMREVRDSILSSLKNIGVYTKIQAGNSVFVEYNKDLFISLDGKDVKVRQTEGKCNCV